MHTQVLRIILYEHATGHSVHWIALRFEDARGLQSARIVYLYNSQELEWIYRFDFALAARERGKLRSI